MTASTLRKLFWRVLVPVLVAVVPTVILTHLGYNEMKGTGRFLPFGRDQREPPADKTKESGDGEQKTSRQPTPAEKKVEKHKATSGDAGGFLGDE